MAAVMCVRVAITLVIGAWVAAAQVKPLRNVSAPRRSAEISVTSVDFQDLHWGHEGPDYFATKRAPKREAREMAEARVFGQDAVGTIRFELVDEAGQLLGVAAAVRTSTGVDDGDYALRVDVPGRPFRFQISGRDAQGKPFSRLYRKLYRPGDEAAPEPQLPAGFSSEQAAKLREFMASTKAQSDARFDAVLRGDPEGWLRMPHTEVAEAGYEMLTATGGHPIGLRLHLNVRFGAGGAYAVRPHVFPLYANTNWRGAVTMKVLDGEVSPQPKNTAADSLADVILYGGAAQYEAGVLYRFQFDIVPGYVIRNKAGTRYCLYLEEVRVSNRLPVWNAIAASSAPVRYRVDLSDLGFTADTELFAPQRAFYEGFLSEGAPDCGPSPSINF
jgi:hypothetical protein